MPTPPDAQGSVAPRVLIVGCGALARELAVVTRDMPGVTVTLLPALLHNRPEGIPGAVRDRIRRERPSYDRIFVAYADCGTGGLLDAMLEGGGRRAIAGRPLLRALQRTARPLRR